MAAAYQPEVDSTAADSVASTPRSEIGDDGAGYSLLPRIRFMCSFGGKILPRPHDNQLRYVGGDTRIVAVHRHTNFSSLMSVLSKLSGTADISVKYQLPSEDLDALITVTADDDVENMIEEYDRLAQGNKSGRLRLFLFPTDSDSRASSISSLLDGSTKRENWFFDVLNGGPASSPVLERGRSEVSSIVSEVPDYLFGLDNSDDALKESAKLKHKNLVNDNISMSDPGSPAPAASSPFCSTSSSLAPAGMQVIPDLPPVKTRPANQEEAGTMNEKPVPQPGGYSGSPMWHYPNPAVQHMPAAVYYVPGGHVQAGNGGVPIRTQFVHPYAVAPVQVPVGFPGVNQVYGMQGNPAVYYGARNVAVVTGGEEMPGSGSDMLPGRVGQGQ